MEQSSHPTLTICGESSWWQHTMRAMSYSHEKTNRDATTTSFLSCVYFSVGETAYISAESTTSTASLTVGEDDPVEITGEGHFLVPVAILNQHISAMPTGDITVSFYPDEGIAKVTDDAGTVEFTCGLVDIINDDMVPNAAVDFPAKAAVVTVAGKDLLDAYKSSSTMALPVEKDPLAGQDPMAGCYITIDGKGVQMFSLSSSAAESFIPSPGKRKANTIITAPNTTLPRLGVFFGSEEVSLSIVKNVLHVDDGSLHMMITPLNIGERKSQMSVDTLVSVLKPAWDAGLVDVTVSGSEFFAALGRAESVGDKNAEISVTDTSLTLSATPTHGHIPFKQKMSCSTQWLDDGEHWTSCVFRIDTLKSISSTVGKRDSLHFKIAVHEDGSPWAMIITPDGFDADNPHDYHLIYLESKS